MFTDRIRNAVLALAGAAIIATALFAPAASAAGAPTAATATTDLREVDPSKMPKIPVGDVSVTPLSLTHDANYQNVQYRFRITNHGPKAVSYRWDGKAFWAHNGAHNGSQTQSGENLLPSLSEPHDVTINCTLSGDPSHYCDGAEVKLTRLGPVLDKNSGNNYAFMPNTFQP